MVFVDRPIGDILLRQGLVMDYQQVLRVALFRRLAEVERPREDRGPVDDNDFVVRDSVGSVDERRNPGVEDEGGRRVFFGSLLLSKTTSILTPRLWASTKALAMGAEVKL